MKKPIYKGMMKIHFGGSREISKYTHNPITQFITPGSAINIPKSPTPQVAGLMPPTLT